MGFADSAKQLLARYNQRQYRAFTLNDDRDLILPQISFIPWVSASNQLDYYSKQIFTPNEALAEDNPHIKFITKGGSPHAFLWTTQAETLKKAVRWGIVQTHSVTAQVIAALGQYRVLAHERVAKGMVSNAQAIKLELLDLFQDRFEALEAMESMVNKDNNLQQYHDVIDQYIQKLTQIRTDLEGYFSETVGTGFNRHTKQKISDDIDADIARAMTYRASIDEKNLRAHHRNRGSAAIMTFVQQQMIHGLYELQGINQDLSYSQQHYFALTRGELNDYIENARKIIDDFQTDPRNAVTAAHHGCYSTQANALISYDFSETPLTPERERSILLGISFIEGWDTLKKTKDGRLEVHNQTGSEPLDTIAATRWKQHRSVRLFLKSYGFYFLNIIKGLFISTHPPEEESWKNPKFHLFATELRQHAKLNEPLWKKPAQFFKNIIYAVRDLFNGIRDVSTELSVRMPVDILNDWESSKVIPAWDDLVKEAEKEFSNIQSIEKERLDSALPNPLKNVHELTITNNNYLAHVEYALTTGEQNDILTSIAKGLNGFTDFIFHHLYAKDPIGGVLFTGTYALGIGAIFNPSMTSALCGTSYVRIFSTYAHSIAASNWAAALSASITQAEIVALGWDGLMHGPSGIAMKTLHKIGEDPLTTATFCAAIYGLGYVLVNGINGYDIPGLSKHFKKELGSKPELAYPGIGLKTAILLHEVLKTDAPENFQLHRLSQEKVLTKRASHETLIHQFNLAHWLSTNAPLLPKLPPKLSFAISRHIELVFNKEDGDSLQKLLHPESYSSMAFKLISGPLSYIPSVLRLAVSFLSSFMAFSTGQPHPVEPINRATTHLMLKIKKDLTRLIVFTNYMLHLPYQILSTLLRTPAYLATMLIGRMAALVDAQPAHAIHQAFAAVHTFFKNVREFFYPARVLKGVTVAHPNHTLLKIDQSSLKLLQQLSTENRAPMLKHDLEEPHHAIFHLLKEPATIEKSSIGDKTHIAFNKTTNDCVV